MNFFIHKIHSEGGLKNIHVRANRFHVCRNFGLALLLIKYKTLNG